MNSKIYYSFLAFLSSFFLPLISTNGVYGFSQKIHKRELELMIGKVKYDIQLINHRPTSLTYSTQNHQQKKLHLIRDYIHNTLKTFEVLFFHNQEAINDLEKRKDQLKLSMKENKKNLKERKILIVKEPKKNNNEYRYYYFGRDELKFLELSNKSLESQLLNAQGTLSMLLEKQKKIEGMVDEIVSALLNTLFTEQIDQILLKIGNRYKNLPKARSLYSTVDYIQPMFHEFKQNIRQIVKDLSKRCDYSAYQPSILKKKNYPFYKYFHRSCDVKVNICHKLMETLPTPKELISYWTDSPPLLANAPRMNKTAQFYNPYKSWSSSSYYKVVQLVSKLDKQVREWDEVITKELLPELKGKKRDLLKRKAYLSEEIAASRYQEYYKEVFKDKKKANIFLERNQIHQKKAIQRINALEDFYYKIQSYQVVVKVKDDSTSEALNRLDTYNKSCLGIWEELYREYWNAQILENEAEGVRGIMHTIPEDPITARRQAMNRPPSFSWGNVINHLAMPIMLPAAYLLRKALVNDKQRVQEELEKDELREACQENLEYQKDIALALTRYYYIEDLASNFNNVFGHKHPLTRELENTRVREEKYQYALVKENQKLIKYQKKGQLQVFKMSDTSEAFINLNNKIKEKLTLKKIKNKQIKIINVRLAFIKGYINSIQKQIGRYKDHLDFLKKKKRARADELGEHIEISQKEEGDLIVSMLENLINQYESMVLDFKLEELSLCLQSKMLRRDMPILEKIPLLDLYEGAYTRREIFDSSKVIQFQYEHIKDKAQAFQKRITALREKERYNVIIRNSAGIQKLISIEHRILSSSLTSCHIGMSLLHVRLSDLEKIIEARKRLAEAAGLAINTISMLVISTPGGPFAIILMPCIKTAAIKAVEDYIMNGGDINGFKEDFLTQETVIRIGKNVITSEVTTLIFTVLPLQAQKVLPKSLQKKLSKWSSLLGVNSSGSSGKLKLFFKEAIKEALSQFSQDMIGIIIGASIDRILEEYTGKKHNTDHLGSRNQKSDSKSSKPVQKLKKRIGEAALNALVMGFAKPITNLLGRWYRDKRNNQHNPGVVSWEDYFTHKLCHSMIGGTIGGCKQLIYKKREWGAFKRAVISGSVGAVIGEVAAELYFDKVIVPSLMKIRSGEITNPDLFRKFYNSMVDQAKIAGKLASIGASYLLGHDIEIAYQAACNAIDNNFAISVALGVELVVFGFGFALIILKSGKTKVISTKTKALNLNWLAVIAQSIMADSKQTDALNELVDGLRQAKQKKTVNSADKKQAPTTNKESGKVTREQAKQKKSVNSDCNNRSKSAYETAKEGGKHSGTYKNYRNRSTKELQKSIKSYERQIERHQNLMKDPARYLKEYGKEIGGQAWSELDKRERQALLNKKWPEEIQNFKKVLNIMKGILKNKK